MLKIFGDAEIVRLFHSRRGFLEQLKPFLYFYFFVCLFFFLLEPVSSVHKSISALSKVISFPQFMDMNAEKRKFHYNLVKFQNIFLPRCLYKRDTTT